MLEQKTPYVSYVNDQKCTQLNFPSGSTRCCPTLSILIHGPTSMGQGVGMRLNAHVARESLLCDRVILNLKYLADNVSILKKKKHVIQEPSGRKGYLYQLEERRNWGLATVASLQAKQPWVILSSCFQTDQTLMAFPHCIILPY